MWPPYCILAHSKANALWDCSYLAYDPGSINMGSKPSCLPSAYSFPPPFPLEAVCLSILISLLGHPPLLLYLSLHRPIPQCPLAPTCPNLPT